MPSPFGGGIIYQILNSYKWAFLLAGMFCLLASLFVIVIQKQTSESIIKEGALKA